MADQKKNVDPVGDDNPGLSEPEWKGEVDDQDFLALKSGKTGKPVEREESESLPSTEEVTNAEIFGDDDFDTESEAEPAELETAVAVADVDAEENPFSIQDWKAFFQANDAMCNFLGENFEKMQAALRDPEPTKSVIELEKLNQEYREVQQSIDDAQRSHDRLFDEVAERTPSRGPIDPKDKLALADKRCDAELFSGIAEKIKQKIARVATQAAGEIDYAIRVQVASRHDFCVGNLRTAIDTTLMQSIGRLVTSATNAAASERRVSHRIVQLQIGDLVSCCDLVVDDRGRILSTKAAQQREAMLERREVG